MRKLLVLIAVTIMTLGLSACTTTSIDLEQLLAEGTMTSEESIATLSYLSAGFLDFESTDPVVKDTSLIQLALSTETDEENTVIEEELDELNVYLDRLKGFMETGVDSFGSVIDAESDNELYTYKLQFTVNEEEYFIYYNVDEVTLEISGIIVIGESEYVFEVVDNIHNYEHHQELNNEQNEEKNNDDDDDDDEPDTEANNQESENNEEQNEEVNKEDEEDDDDETGSKMILIATNGEDSIKIKYINEVEDDEVTTKFYMVKTIAGVTSEVSMKISQEEDEYKVSIEEDGNSYTFKQETEDDGTVYKLQYEVDGTKGQVKIIEMIDEDGNITYKYQIQEAGRNKNVEKQEPQSKGLDDDEDDEENESGNKQDNSTNQNNAA